MSNDLPHAQPTIRARRSTRVLAGLAVVLALAVALVAFAASAGASTSRVQGRQIAVNEKKGKYRMRGGLIGSWRITSFKQVATHPIYRGQGTEKFRGCLNLDRHPGCSGDPSGTLAFKFRYWARFKPDGSLIWGSCWHPITGGTGDLAGARGVLVMADTPTRRGVKTRYTGNITLGSASKARSTPAPHCG